MNEKNTGAYNFPIPGRVRKECSECGQTFRGREDELICIECEHKRDHPEARDMHWTWQRGARGSRDIAAYWPDREPFPEPGDQLTVHRKDGATDTVTVWDAHAVRDLATGQGRVHCKVYIPREK